VAKRRGSCTGGLRTDLQNQFARREEVWPHGEKFTPFLSLSTFYNRKLRGEHIAFTPRVSNTSVGVKSLGGEIETGSCVFRLCRDPKLSPRATSLT
jgi:hypothetical protein